MYQINRYNKDFYYDPAFVSIGPYHRGKEKLKAMEEYKWRYLSDFLSRNRNNTVENYMKMLNELEADARNCYFEDINLDSKEFVEMLLLDGCFIIEFLLKYYGRTGDFEPKANIRGINWNLNQIWEDLILLENQIPFVVIQRLFDLMMGYTSSGPDVSNDGKNGEKKTKKTNLVRIAAEFLSDDYKWMKQKPIASEDVYHLLHLYHHYNAPPLEFTQSNSHSLRDQVNSFWKWFSWGKVKENDEPSETKTDDIQSTAQVNVEPSSTDQNHDDDNDDNDDDNEDNNDNDDDDNDDDDDDADDDNESLSSNEDDDETSMPPATKLIESGVKLRKKKKAKSFLDITFENGILEIPSFMIDESRRSRLMNLVVFEQCNFKEDIRLQTTSSYVQFMDDLIDTPRDVEILRHRGIIKSYLKSNEEAALFFNHLTDYVYTDEEINADMMNPLCKQVNMFCKSNWQQSWAKLMRDYFSSPWTIVSLVAAIILLILTFVQTFFTVYPYYNTSS